MRGEAARWPTLAGLLTAFVSLAWGSSWDAHWHWWIGRDSVWIPPHLLLYTGIGLSIAVAVFMRWQWVLNRTLAPDVPGAGRDLPSAHHVVGVGAAAMMAAAAIDLVWHRLIGDRTIWSPPHVLFVLGGLTVGVGTGAAFVQAEREGLIPSWPVRAAIGIFVGVLLNAGAFSFLPIAILVFHAERVDTSMLLFTPPPAMLAGFASAVMPMVLLVSKTILRRPGLAAVALTGIAFWAAEELLHLALTPPVATAMGFVVRPSAFPEWPFELVIFGASLAPVLAAYALIPGRPTLAGAYSGILYATVVQIGLHLYGVPAAINGWGVAVCTLLGSASGVAGSVGGRWIGNVIYSAPADAKALTQLSPSDVVVSFLGFFSRVSPNLRRRLWKLLYETLAARDDDANWAFMNYGFADLDAQATRLQLSPADEKDRCAIQLYHHVAASVDLEGRDVMEVGCGRGGGASYVARYLRPRSLVGVDVSPKAIAHCRRHRTAAGLSFACGDAEALPFDDGKFDVMINIESSHCYGSMDRFLAEAHRVLRPHGMLLFADLRFSDGIAQLRDQLRSSPFQLLEDHTITKNVVRALEWDHTRRLALIRQKVPRPFRGPFLRFAGATGTRTYEMLRDGEGEYFCCILYKATS